MTKHVLTLPNKKELSASQTRKLLRDYRRDCPAVLELFDGTNPGPHDTLFEIDILSINALNAFGSASPMRAMTAAWTKRKKIEGAVREITKAELQALSGREMGRQARLIDRAVCVIDDIFGFGYTASSKLLHRLRPNVAPIWDSKVAKWYPEAKYHDAWEPWINRMFSDVLAPQNRYCLETASQDLPHGLSLVRLWDIVLWQQKAPSGSSVPHSMP